MTVWLILLTLVVFALIGAAGWLWLRWSEAEAEIVHLQAHNRLVCKRVEALESRPAPEPAPAIDYLARFDRAARAAVVDALQCGVDSLSFARQSEDQADA